MFQKTYAKVNLFLDILSRRKDGFHNIKTIFSEIELYDELNFTLTKNKGIKILTEIDELSGEKNLIYQVAFFIQSYYRVNRGCEIILKKNIPIAAGLGGGSSDAALTIKGLSKLWNLELDLNQMLNIAMKFGSDINFFLSGGTAIGVGRGEKITPIKDIIIDNMVIINPGFPISSKEAYELMSNYQCSSDIYDSFMKNHNPQYTYNAFETVLREKYPTLKEIDNKCMKMGAKKTLISGSGSSIIAFCEDNVIASTISEYYTEKKYWNIITKTKRRTL